MNKQQLLLEYLISSPDTFTLCKSIIRPDYFDPEFRKAVSFINSYYDKYSAVPTPDQIYAESKLELSLQPITRDKIKYCADEVEAFCRRRALERAIIAAPALIVSGDHAALEQSITDALLISLSKDIGIDYFDNPFSRLESQSLNPLRTPTKWNKFDELLFGGLARKELLLVSANSGGGKSITLGNLAVNFVTQKFKVLYLTLELAQELVAQRFDTMFTGIPTILSQQKYVDIANSLQVQAPNMGSLVIKHMSSGTTSNTIRSYLKEYELATGCIPDMLIVDYLDIMGSNEYVSADNVFEKDKRATEQLRDIAFDYNLFVVTASQQNRAAIEAQELTQGHIAGGLSKVNTVDVYVSVILTPTMKAAGEIGFTFLKTRNSDGVGKTIYLRWDNKSLRILNSSAEEDIDGDGVIQDRISGIKNKFQPKRSLTDLMDN